MSDRHTWNKLDVVGAFYLTKCYEDNKSAFTQDVLVIRLRNLHPNITVGSIGMAIGNFRYLLGWPGGLSSASQLGQEVFEKYKHLTLEELKTEMEIMFKLEEMSLKWQYWTMKSKATLQDGFGSPGSFYLRLYDAGGCGACCDVSDTIMSFETLQDALSFIRWIQIPLITNFMLNALPENSDESKEIQTTRVMFYERFERLIGASEIQTAELDSLFTLFNKSYGDTNPSNQILAYGPLAVVFASVKKKVTSLAEMGNAVSKLLLAAMNAGLDDTNPKHREIACDWACNN